MIKTPRILKLDEDGRQSPNWHSEEFSLNPIFYSPNCTVCSLRVNYISHRPTSCPIWGIIIRQLLEWDFGLAI